MFQAFQFNWAMFRRTEMRRERDYESTTTHSSSAPTMDMSMHGQCIYNFLKVDNMVQCFLGTVDGVTDDMSSYMKARCKNWSLYNFMRAINVFHEPLESESTSSTAGDIPLESGKFKFLVRHSTSRCTISTYMVTQWR
jgi:hypothetical protein